MTRRYDFPHLLLGYLLPYNQLLRELLPKRCLKPFPDAAAQREQALIGIHPSLLSSVTRNVHWIVGSRTTSAGCSGNRQLSLLELNTRLSIHVSPGSRICMIAHSETGTCTRSTLGCAHALLSQPQLLKAACLNKACRELSLATEAKLYVSGCGCSSRSGPPAGRVCRSCSGDSCKGCSAPKSLLPHGLGHQLSLFFIHSQLQNWVLGYSAEPSHLGDLPWAPGFPQVRGPPTEATPEDFRVACNL